MIKNSKYYLIIALFIIFNTNISMALEEPAHKIIKSIRSINKKLREFEENYSDKSSEKLIAFSIKLRKSFSEIEKTLYQTKNRSNQDPLNFPIKLTNKLAHLNRLVTMNDFPPTNQDLMVKNELSNLIQAELNKYDNLIENDLKKFNEEFSELELDYLILKK